MKCLNEYQLELLETDKAGVRGYLWRRHLDVCRDCRDKAAEIRENLTLAAAVKNARHHLGAGRERATTSGD